MELNYVGKTGCNDICGDGACLLGQSSTDSCLIFGENMVALKLLLETHRGKIDLIYIDPPFNTNQVFSITDNRRNTISRAKSPIIAYSDKMSRAEYIEFIRERLILLRELLE